VIYEGHVGYREILYVTFRFIFGEVKGNRRGHREKKAAEDAEKMKPQRAQRKENRRGRGEKGNRRGRREKGAVESAEKREPQRA
jgi:hypothetical protein